MQFPSFHTALSILMIVALRGCGPVGWIAGFYNFLILLTVPIDGGHYFVDMIAGGTIAVIVWYGLAALNQMGARDVEFKYFASAPELMGDLTTRIGERMSPIASLLMSQKSR